MQIFKSVQFNALLAMLLVNLVIATVIHATYITYIRENQRKVQADRLERALAQYASSTHPSRNTDRDLLLLRQRYDLDGVGVYDPNSRMLAFSMGLPTCLRKAETLQQFVRDKQIPSTQIWKENTDCAAMIGVATLRTETNQPYLLVVSLSLANERILENSLAGIFLITLCGGVLLTLLLSYLLRRRIVHALQAFNRSVAAASQGDLSCHIPLNTDLEFVPLAEGMNRMLSELQDNRTELLEYQQTLEQRIEEARRELHQKDAELLQAEKLASIGELAAGVAHEINNPLQNILLICDILQQDLTDPAQTKQAERIQTQTRLCRNIVNDLLEYSRSSVLHMEPLQLDDVLHDTIDNLRQTGQLQEISLEWEVPGNLPQICGSREELCRAFYNILHNAAHALQETPSASPVIHVRVREDNTPYLLIQLEDNGPGISTEVCARVFEPFFTTKEVGKGTGLGLSIAYGIIARHRGTIALESQEGQGTVVSVRLPKHTDTKEQP